MPHKEIKAIARNIKKRLKNDKNRPYQVRKKVGDIDRFGKQAYELFTIDKMLTQPLGFKEFSRLPEGDKQKTWRFVAVLPPEELEIQYEVMYKGQWFEVKKVNDWELVKSAHMVVIK